MSVLSRPKPTRKSDYDLDVAFPSSPVSPISQSSFLPIPDNGRKTKRQSSPASRTSQTITSCSRFRICPHNSPLDPEVVRKDFLENSSFPLPPTAASASP